LIKLGTYICVLVHGSDFVIKTGIGSRNEPSVLATTFVFTTTYLTIIFVAVTTLTKTNVLTATKKCCS